MVIKESQVFLDNIAQYKTVGRQLNGTLLCHDLQFL